MFLAVLGLMLGVAALVVSSVDSAPGWAAIALLAGGIVFLAWGVRSIVTRGPMAHGGAAMEYHTPDWEDVPFREESGVQIESGAPFKKQPLPRSGRLAGGFSHIFYKEFDTIEHPDEWRQFLYDPLSSLDGHGVLAVADEAARREDRDPETTPLLIHEDRDPEKTPLLIHIAIYKLTEPGAKPMGAGAVGETVDTLGSARRNYRVVTTVVNHEEPLNPRIGMTSVLA
jgi:hypothetical protein